MFFSNQRSVFPDWRPVFLEVGSPLVWLYDTDVVWRCLDTVTQLLVHLEWEFNGVYMWKDGGGILLHHPLPPIVPSHKKMRRDCHSTRCWVVCFGMDLRPSDRCHDGGHMVLWFLFFLRFVKGVLEIWKESTNFRFASCLTFFWVRYVDAIGRNDVGHLRKRFQIFSNLLEAFRKNYTSIDPR